MAPGPDPDLDDVRAGRDEVANPVRGDDVAGTDRDLEAEVADRAEGLEHLLLVAVRRVDDEQVDAGGRQLLGPADHVAVDADRRRDTEVVVGVDVGPVDGRPQRTLPGEDPDQAAVTVHRRGQPVPGGAEPREGVLRGLVGPDGHDLAAHDVAHLREPVDPGEVGLGDQADRVVTLVDDDRGPVGPLLQQGQGRADGLDRVDGDRGVVHEVAGLDEGDDVGDDVGRDVLGDHRQAAATGHRLGHPASGDRGHVGDDDRDGVARTVRAGEVDVHPGGHRGPGRDHEDVVVGQVERRLEAVEEPHRTRLPARGHTRRCRGTRTSS